MYIKCVLENLKVRIKLETLVEDYWCSARVYSARQQYLRIPGNVWRTPSRSPIRVSPRSIPWTSLGRGHSEVKGSPYTSRLSLLQSLMNEPFVSWQSCGRYRPESSFITQPSTNHDFRNILIRTQVRRKTRLTRRRQITRPHAIFFHAAVLRRAGFNHLIGNLIGFTRRFIINSLFWSYFFLGKHRHLWQFRSTIHRDSISRGWSPRKRHSLRILRKRVVSIVNNNWVS